MPCSLMSARTSTRCSTRSSGRSPKVTGTSLPWAMTSSRSSPGPAPCRGSWRSWRETSTSSRSSSWRRTAAMRGGSSRRRDGCCGTIPRCSRRRCAPPGSRRSASRCRRSTRTTPSRRGSSRTSCGTGASPGCRGASSACSIARTRWGRASRECCCRRACPAGSRRVAPCRTTPWCSTSSPPCASSRRRAIPSPRNRSPGSCCRKRCTSGSAPRPRRPTPSSWSGSA